MYSWNGLDYIWIIPKKLSIHIWNIFIPSPNCKDQQFAAKNIIAKCCYAIENPFYPETV